MEIALSILSLVTAALSLGEAYLSLKATREKESKDTRQTELLSQNKVDPKVTHPVAHQTQGGELRRQGASGHPAQHDLQDSADS